MKQLGSNFYDALVDAGLNGLPFSWSTEGVLTFDPSMSPEKIASVQAVYDSYEYSGLQAAQDSQWASIRAERDRRTACGGYYVSSVAKWFHSDNLSRIQQIALTMLGSTMPPTLQWKTMDGSFVQMTPALALEVFTAASNSDQAVFAHAEALHQQVMAAANPMTVDVMAEWPKVYGE